MTGQRIAGLLRTAGYPPAVAAALAGLLITVTPAPVLRAAPAAAGETAWEPRRRLLDRLAGPHLPQGAPTSPAAANLLAHRLDRRVAGLAAAVGATYGRYADDLVLSGDAGLPVRGSSPGSRRSRPRRGSGCGRTRRACCRRTTGSASPAWC